MHEQVSKYNKDVQHTVICTGTPYKSYWYWNCATTRALSKGTDPNKIRQNGGFSELAIPVSYCREMKKLLLATAICRTAFGQERFKLWNDVSAVWNTFATTAAARALDQAAV